MPVGRLRIALALALCLAAGSVSAKEDGLVAELEQQLARSGAEQVNAHLSANWSAAMLPLNQRTAECDRRAVSLSVRLNRGADARASQAHGDALRAATGKCMGFVLALAALDEVPRYCGAISSWSATQTARELRRRVALVDASEVLRTSERGRACRAASQYELRNTRVGLRVRS